MNTQPYNHVLKVSLDGGETYIDAPMGVRIIYTNVSVPGEEAPSELHLNVMNDSIIKDVLVKRNGEDHILVNTVDSLDGLISRLINEEE